MAFSITTAFVQQYSGNVQMLAQQMQSRLRGKTLEDQVTGESAFLEQMAPSAAVKVQSRNADTPIMNTQSLRRRVTTFGYDWGDLVDKDDELRTLIDPTNKYAIAGAAAMRRAQDDEIISAFFATAYTGHTGSTAVTWPNGDAEGSPTAPAGTVVAVDSWAYGNGSGATGLTISKLIEARTALVQAEGDEDEEFYFVCQAKQIANLLSTTEATSADYSTVMALNKGQIDSFMGFQFVRSERLQTDSSGYRRCCAYRKPGMGLGITRDITAQIGPRTDKRFATQVYLNQVIGATRMQEAKVCEIKCA